MSNYQFLKIDISTSIVLLCKSKKLLILNY